MAWRRGICSLINQVHLTKKEVERIAAYVHLLEGLLPITIQTNNDSGIGVYVSLILHDQVIDVTDYDSW